MPHKNDTITDIIDSAISWISEDADHPDTPPEEWQRVIPIIEQAADMRIVLQSAVERWERPFTEEEDISGADVVDWLATWLPMADKLLIQTGAKTDEPTVLPPTEANLLRDCLGTMQAMRDQIDQMSGMFSDEDGTIQDACDAHDETAEAVTAALGGVASPEPRLTDGPHRYLVGWRIDIWAGTAREAAEKAFKRFFKPGHIANVFEVVDDRAHAVEVDLEDDGETVPVPQSGPS